MRGRKRPYYCVQTIIHANQTVSLESYRNTRAEEREAMSGERRWAREHRALLINQVYCNTVTMRRLMLLKPALEENNASLCQKARDAEQAEYQEQRGAVGINRDQGVERLEDALSAFKWARGTDSEETAWFRLLAVIEGVPVETNVEEWVILKDLGCTGGSLADPEAGPSRSYWTGLRFSQEKDDAHCYTGYLDARLEAERLRRQNWNGTIRVEQLQGALRP